MCASDTPADVHARKCISPHLPYCFITLQLLTPIPTEYQRVSVMMIWFTSLRMEAYASSFIGELSGPNLISGTSIGCVCACVCVCVRGERGYVCVRHYLARLFISTEIDSVLDSCQCLESVEHCQCEVNDSDE